MNSKRVLLINGSPKNKLSQSEIILNFLESKLTADMEIFSKHIRTANFTEDLSQLVESCDVIVFAFPLYVDGIPAHLLPNLKAMERMNAHKTLSDKEIYVVVNCGFYEGNQAHIALDMMKNWCIRAKFDWKQGLGLGAGGMVYSLVTIPENQGPRKNYDKALNELVENIRNGHSGEDLFVSPNFPKLAYKLAAEFGWRKSIKINGLQKRDLDKRIS